jgi:hypothetical protein
VEAETATEQPNLSAQEWGVAPGDLVLVPNPKV